MWVIEKANQGEGDLAHAMVILQQHDTISACRREAVAGVARAKSALDNLPVHPLREILSELADFVVSRVS